MVTSKALLYAQISHDLAHSIRRGELEPGSLVPTVTELQAHYGVSHITVLHAYRQLVQDGLIAKMGRRYFVAQPEANCGKRQRLISGFRSLTTINDRDNYGNQIMVGLMRSCAAHNWDFVVPPVTAQFNGVNKLQDEHLLELVRNVRYGGYQMPLLVLDYRFTDEQIQRLVLPLIPGNRIVVAGRPCSLPLFSVGQDFESLGQDAARILYENNPQKHYWLFPCLGEETNSNLAIPSCVAMLEQLGVPRSHINLLPISNQTYDQDMDSCRRVDEFLKRHPGQLSILAISPYWGRLLSKHLQEVGWTPRQDFRMLVSMGFELCFNEEPKLSAIAYDGEAVGNTAINLLASKDTRPVGFYAVDHSIKLQSTT